MPFCRTLPTKKVLVLGLDGSGKTSILTVYKDQPEPHGHPFAVLPTVGVEMHEFVKDKIKWRVWDCGGQGRYRELWPRFYGKCDAIVWVVDATDDSRVGVLRDEFGRMLRHPDVTAKRVPVLVLINKSEVGDGSKLNSTNVPKALLLDAVATTRLVKAVACNAVSQSGIDDGLAWLRSVMLA